MARTAHASVTAGRARELVWAASVGLVLADSSVVTLALPDILRRFDATVVGVSWVLTAFNVVLAVGVVLAARAGASAGGERAARIWTGGIVVFALASLVCALAPSLPVLVGSRCLQAAGGCAVIVGAIELLARSRGSHLAAAPVWGAASLAGVALGPAVGGLLTELVSWEAIFAVQVPVVLAAVVARRAPAGRSEPGRPGRPSAGPEVALALLSAGLTGALFLLVIMLTEGWGRTPLEAAVIVSTMAVATVAAQVLTRRVDQGRAVMASGAVAVAGGLVALGLLPDADPLLTLAPQALVGIGIALALPGLTARALGGADPQGRRAASTIGARHAGIVLALVLLTPLFAAELEAQERAAERAGTALLLDADLPPRTKIELGASIARAIDRADGRLPDLSAAFREVTPPPAARAELARLEARLGEEIDRAATSAFSTVFLVAGGLALLAVVPIALGGGAAQRGRTAGLPVAGALACSLGLVGIHLGAGGARYEPLAVADPCASRPVERGQPREQVLERLALSALDGAACELRVTREELTLALAGADARAAFAREHRIGPDEVEAALRSGAVRAIDDAQRAGAISAPEAMLLQQAADLVPADALVDALEAAGEQGAVGLLDDLLGRIGP